MTTKSLNISRLLVYPIKSCGPVDVSELECDAMGPIYDRRFMLTKPNGLFLSQRAHPKLALVQPSIADGMLTLAAPGMSRLSFPLQPPTGDEKPIRIFRTESRAKPVAGEAHEWFSTYLSEPVQLVTAVPSARFYYGTSVAFPDGAQLHLITEESLAAVSQAGDSGYSILNFRPNIVAHGLGDPFVEESITALHTDHIRLESQGPCERCVIPNVDPQAGRFRDGADILGLLKSLRNTQSSSPTFGVLLKVTEGNRIRIEDSLTLV